MSKDFKLRIDVTFSDKNMSYATLNWLKKKYHKYAGNKTEFIRQLINSLYKYEQGVIENEGKQELKEEILGYVIKNLNFEDAELNQQKTKLVNDISNKQAQTQDILLDQLENI
ncbi:hypothetical protein JCM16358_15730 [Halanaerocella petrolearia]